METELAAIVRPKVNRRFLGWRFKLSMYNLAGDSTKKNNFIRRWLRDKIGEPPVLGSQFIPRQNQDLLVNYLQNKGYFNAKAYGIKDVDEHQHATGSFDVLLGDRYFYNEIDYSPTDKTGLSKEIAALKEKSLLKKGDPYDLETIKAERERINAILKNKGYYYFSPDFLVVYADTTVGAHLIDARLKLQYSLMPQAAYRSYTIKDIEIFPQYRFSLKDNNTADRYSASNDTIVQDGLSIIQRNKKFAPRVFRQSVLFRPGDTYSPKIQNATLNRLVNLGVFKFVKNEFSPVVDTNSMMYKMVQTSPAISFLAKQGMLDSFNNQLNIRYLLTPQPTRQANVEVAAYTQNDSRAGSKISFAWRNRYLFKSAELLTLKFTGGFEMQFGGKVNIPNTYNAGVEASLNFPRTVLPFMKRNIGSSAFVPRTLATLGYDFYLRNQLYSIHSLNTSFGYNWKESIRKEHKLFPINVTYVNIDTFANTIAAQDFNLSNLLFKGVILGPTYEFTYNTLTDNNATLKSNYYFNSVVDFSGNILGIVQGAKINEPTKQILGANYAQYMKFTLDGRYFYKFNPQGTRSIATRLYLGLGYPYGNSYTLPNIKQYFAGGASSLRGFQSRRVGPGSYNALADSIQYVELLGDVKLEANIEFRAQLYQFIHGAIFMDAGNIWLLRDNPAFPGGKFSSNFANEIAVDAGIGLRFDFKILLLRFDFGMPIRKPWMPVGERWVFNKIDFGSPIWRKENLVFSLAIGYPF